MTVNNTKWYKATFSSQTHLTSKHSHVHNTIDKIPRFLSSPPLYSDIKKSTHPVAEDV